MYAWLISICAIDQYAYMYISVWIQQTHVHIEKDTIVIMSIIIFEKDREGCQDKIIHVHVVMYIMLSIYMYILVLF